MKKFIALMLLIALSFTSLPLAYADFANGTLVQTETGFKPIEQIRVGDLVYAKDETTGKTEYHRVVQLFQRQADETYHITVKGIPITTTGEHPFWVHGQGWVEARDLKVGDLLQSPEGKPYSIDRIEMMNNSTSGYNFEVEGVHNYFVTESEIWTHNFVAPIVRAIVQVVTKNVAKNTAKEVAKNAAKVSRGTGEVTRKQAFNQAKRDSGIPTSATPTKQGMVRNYKNSTNDRRVYQYNVDGKRKYIIEHQNDPFGRGPHFHGAIQKYPGQDLFRADERYRRIQGIQGHYPENFGGFIRNGRR